MAVGTSEENSEGWVRHGEKEWKKRLRVKWKHEMYRHTGLFPLGWNRSNKVRNRDWYGYSYCLGPDPGEQGDHVFVLLIYKGTLQLIVLKSLWLLIFILHYYFLSSAGPLTPVTCLRPINNLLMVSIQPDWSFYWQQWDAKELWLNIFLEPRSFSWDSDRLMPVICVWVF